MNVMDDLDHSSLSGMVMIKTLLQLIEERVAEVEITDNREFLKLFSKEGIGAKCDDILFSCSFYCFVTYRYLRYTLLKLV